MTFGELFLTYPDLFPARAGGEACGDRSLTVDFVGGPYRFTGLDEEQEQLIREHFDDLCVPLARSTGEMGVETRVFRVAASDFREFELSGWDYSFDLDFQPNAVRIAGLDFMARLEWRPHLQAALWISEASATRFPRLVFTNVIRVLAAYRLVERGGVLLHSAGVVDQEQADLFLGRSGAGKTTLSRLGLASGRIVLSDDINAVTWAAGQPMVHKVPFSGELGRTDTHDTAYPARSVCRLVKDQQTTLSPLRPAESLALLIVCSPIVNSDPYRFGQLTQNLEAIARNLPCYRLHLALGADPWPALRRAITARSHQ